MLHFCLVWVPSHGLKEDLETKVSDTLIVALRRWRHEDCHEFEASLSNNVSKGVGASVMVACLSAQHQGCGLLKDTGSSRGQPFAEIHRQHPREHARRGRYSKVQFT